MCSADPITTLLPGDWREFDSFVWWPDSRPDDCDDFAIVYTHHRESDLIDESNAAIIGKALAPFCDGNDADVIPQDHNHWAVGWIKGYAIRVYRNNELTPAARVWDELQSQIADYPILDESHYSELESEAQEQAWNDWARSEFTSELEKAFECELSADPDQIYELFHSLCERGNVYWETGSSGVYIHISHLIEIVTADDIADLVTDVGIVIFCNGDWFDTGFYKLGLVSGSPQNADILEWIGMAIVEGDSEFSHPSGLYTWQLG